MADTPPPVQPQQPVPPAPQQTTPTIVPGNTSTQSNMYPLFTVKNIEHPNRFLAIPFIGLLIRILLLIPALLLLGLVSFAVVAVWIILPFYILFKGKYWDIAHAVIEASMIYSTKISLYIFGLTDKYPGFNFDTNGLFELQVAKPEKPSKLLSFPLFGFLIRVIILIPFSIFVTVMNNGSRVALFGSWFAVLFTGKYPESLYEFTRDFFRVTLSSQMYMMYLSDKYPSFSISMNHKPIKIILIILGVLMTIGASMNELNSSSSTPIDTNFQTAPVDINT